MSFTVRGVSDWQAAKYAFAVVLLAGGLQTAQSQAKLDTPLQTNQKIQELAGLTRVRPADTPIGSGDLLHIDIFDAPELSRDVRVSDTGDISYPLIPAKIAAAGLTTFELETKLAQLLVANGLVSRPDVSVFVREQNSQPVSVVGAVNHPMVYQVARATTLLEVLSAAGGVTDDAGSVVIVTRPAGGNPPLGQADGAASKTGQDEQKITIRLRDLLESGESVYNIQVYGGDSVTVPRAGIVYVLGFGVAQPGGYVLQSRGEDITVLKAIALAHGLTTFAKPDDAVIMRTNPATGQKDQIPVHLRKIAKHQADDVPLLTNDILYVPDSTGMKVLAHTGAAVVTAGSAVALYRVP